MPPRFPVFWLTAVGFAIIAAATRNLLVAGFLLGVILPAVWIGQWGIRWLCKRFHAPVWFRRAVMLLPALVLGVSLFRSTNDFGGKQAAAVAAALAGQTPGGMREVRVQVDDWTDFGVQAYFRCDSASLRGILERHPFIRSDYQPGKFSFAQTPFADLHGRPDAHGVVVFSRTDLEPAQGWCEVYTDSTFSFAFVSYGVD